VFRGLTDDEIARCTERSTLIACKVRDQILKRGGTARNPFVVVSGRLEARVGVKLLLNVSSALWLRLRDGSLLTG
jgi:hypothetical protein